MKDNDTVSARNIQQNKLYRGTENFWSGNKNNYHNENCSKCVALKIYFLVTPVYFEEFKYIYI